MAPRKYIEKMIDSCKNMFNENPSTNFKSPPLEKGDHPERDNTELLDPVGVHKF